MATLIRTTDELSRFRATEAREPLEEAEFRRRLTESLARCASGIVADHAFLSLPSDSDGWVDTGIDVPAGGAVTIFSTGRAVVPADAEAQLSADDALWTRVTLAAEARRCPWHRIGPDGEVLRGGRSSHTVVADRAGRLLLANVVPPDPRPTTETSQFDDMPAAPPIDRCALVVRWAVDPLEGLAALRAAGGVEGLVASALADHQSVVALPEGWCYPHTSGPMDQFTSETIDGFPAHIGCYSCDAGALLSRSLDLPLLAGTTLRWEWKIDELPSRSREDVLATHDYLSIAVEFDNATDLTYFWSAELRPDTAFACPIPGWGGRETHVVVRSGTGELGTWCAEERDVVADYRRFVGEPPAKITGVWLLAVTWFQGLPGRCDYRRIELESGSSRLSLH